MAQNKVEWSLLRADLHCPGTTTLPCIFHAPGLSPNITNTKNNNENKTAYWHSNTACPRNVFPLVHLPIVDHGLALGLGGEL